MGNDSSFAAKCGRFLGHLVVACVCICATSLLLAGTARILAWIITGM